MSLHQTFFTCMNPWLKCSATWHISGGREYAGDRMVSSFCRAATMEMGGAHGPPGQLYREGAGRRGHWTSFFKEEIKKRSKNHKYAFVESRTQDLPLTKRVL